MILSLQHLNPKPKTSSTKPKPLNSAMNAEIVQGAPRLDHGCQLLAHVDRVQTLSRCVDRMDSIS